MMRKRIRGGSAALLALLFAFSLIAVPKVYAATAVETDRICSVDFSIAGEFEELEICAGRGCNRALQKLHPLTNPVSIRRLIHFQLWMLHLLRMMRLQLIPA